MLLAVISLFVSTLACGMSLPTLTTLNNVRTARDKDGKQLTSVFTPTDTVYILADISNG